MPELGIRRSQQLDSGSNFRTFSDAKEVEKPSYKELDRALQDLREILPWIEALRGKSVVAVFPDDNYMSKDLEVPHSLGKVPKDAILGLVTRTSLVATEMVVERSQTPWTNKAIYLRSNSAGSVTLYLVA